MENLNRGSNLSESVKFASWLNDFTGTLKGKNNGYVPCGDCVGCCTSAYFIHLKPTDKNSIKHIPRELMFPAPGLPKGNYLLGYDENGYCPMFKKGRCSIYKYRPETCRQYDCRVYPATGIFPDDKKSQIYEKAKGWKFDISSSNDIKAFEAVQRASKFITKYRELFPKKFFPRNAPQLAVLAIRIHLELMKIDSDKIEKTAQALVDLIVLKYGSHG
jgi:Fe-S-cluster containining protein